MVSSDLRKHCALGVATGVALSLLVVPVRATTTLTVDLSTSLHPVAHAASGSLYGLTEKLPADLSTLVAPLNPNVFINPAADVQQPVGDAIVVAGRVAPLGARVTIRLADWFPSWPYRFTTMTDWFDKLGQTASRKAASNVDNYYGYEIWNEPNGTWTSSMSFNDFWQQSYAKLRELDPNAKLIGPSISFYDANYLRSFLSFAKTNSCVPDIVSWHELSGGNLTANFQNYRALEQELGIGPLPISINEYSGKNDLTDEGMPGASAPMIAKFERFGIDSACISYWDVAHPGRLGSLLASDTAPNGGYWFYKWYGDMHGVMVSTTPPAPNDATALDGFANLDANTQTAGVLFGGANDGTINVVVKGFEAATFFGATVHANVEHTHWVNRTTAVNATDTVVTSDLAVSNDQVSVTVKQANATDGYRLLLTPIGAMGGASGNGGGGFGGTASGNGGRSGAGGGGGIMAGGATNGGTTSGSAGSAFGGMPAAGNTGNAGAMTATSGAGTGENATGGANAGGHGGDTPSSAGTGALRGNAGTTATGGTGSGGLSSSAGLGGGAPEQPATKPASSGCTCAFERSTSPRQSLLWVLAGGALLAVRRRRTSAAANASLLTGRVTSSSRRTQRGRDLRAASPATNA